MGETLETVLGDAREQASVLRYHGHAAQARSVEDVVDRVAGVMRSYLTVLSEKEAMMRSGKGVDFFRARFPEWEARGLAVLDERGRRTYREITVPVRPQLEVARLAGERGESIRGVRRGA